MLSPDSTWRMAFFRLLAELSDELLPDEYQSTLASGRNPDGGALWAAMGLPTNPIAARDLGTPVDTIVSHAEESGLLGGVTAEDLFMLLLGRPLGRAESWVAGLSVESAMATILLSPEFSRSLPWIAKSVIGRGRWNYFVHIPKTAGSQFQAMAWSHFGAGSLLRGFHDDDRGVSHPWATSAWIRRLLNDDGLDMWISGHLRINELRPIHSAWPSDRVLTIVRDPIDQVLSAVNYFYRLRQEQPADAQRYFSAMLGDRVPPDLDSLDLEEAVLAVAEKDFRLRPSYFFEHDVLDAATRQHVVVGFQENLQALLEFVVDGDELRLPSGVAEGAVRVNKSPAAISVADLNPQVLAEVGRRNREAVADYYTLRRLAGTAPYVHHV